MAKGPEACPYESHLDILFPRGALVGLPPVISGVKRFHPHRMRHTLAGRWLERGGSLAALQQMLGHSSIVTTQRSGRISDEQLGREAERVEVAAGGRANR